MTQQQTESPAKKRKHKDFAQINGNCKMAKLSDGYAPKSCPDCGTNHKLKICPWCGYVRERSSMSPFIKNTQHIRIERREWYDYLQHDISPLFKPDRIDSDVALCLSRLDNSPQAIRFFASQSQHLTDYGYWFFLGTCWVQYTGWSELDLWKSLFSSSRPHRESCLMKPTELRHFRALPKTVHCYRVHRPDEQDWISYTLDFDTAKKFAGIRGVSQIHEYRIPRKRLACLFLRRQEYEVLCIDNKHARLHAVTELQ